MSSALIETSKGAGSETSESSEPPPPQALNSNGSAAIMPIFCTSEGKAAGLNKHLA